MKILILHAYSADNAGDGLLVSLSMELLREALGNELDVTILASRPDSFSKVDAEVVGTVPGQRGYLTGLLRILRNIDSFDLVIGVGGGYLRADSIGSAVKALVVQGPQLAAASKTRVPAIYLPQSIGPARGLANLLLKSAVGRLNKVMVRDDRSLAEIGSKNSLRMPDLALFRIPGARGKGAAPSNVPVVSIRAVRNWVNPSVYELTDSIGTYDAYVQSVVGGNDDRPATNTLRPREIIPASELLRSDAEPRVVVAVRLHAALMALTAGHYVIHLAYERKGFGAYQDLQLLPWVHNFRSFDPVLVQEQIRALTEDENLRSDYEARIAGSSGRLSGAWAEMKRQIRSYAGSST